MSKTNITYCSMSHAKDENCPCPKHNPQGQLIFDKNKNLHTFRVHKTLTTKKSNDKIQFSNQDINEEFYNKKDLMSSLDTKIDHFDFSHIKDKQILASLERLFTKYDKEGLFSKPGSPIGKFKYFECSFQMPEGVNATQKKRPINWGKAPKAIKKIRELVENGILAPAEEEPLAISNFCLVTKCPAGSHLRLATKADKHIQKLSGEIEWRITSDLTTINSYMQGAVTTVLPDIEQIKKQVANNICSTWDIADGYFNLVLAPTSTRWLAMYGPDGEILVWKRLPQGAKISSKLFCDAMKQTLHQDVLAEFKAKRKLSEKEFPFTSYDQFSSYYLDDVVTFTSAKAEKAQQLHLLACDALMYSMLRAGFKMKKSKCNIMVSSFFFLGQKMVPGSAYSCISPQRIEAILKQRIPRSTGETASRASYASYSFNFLPFGRLLALPLTNMVHQNKFSWSKPIAEAYNELKLLACLAVKNFTFNENCDQVIQSDASKVCAAYSHWQLAENGELQLITCKTRIFSSSESHLVSVFREIRSLIYAFHDVEPYIKSCNKSVIMITDCEALQALQRTKNFNHKYYDFIISLSQYDNLKIAFLNGRWNIVADQLSRQFNAIFLDTASQSADERKVSEMASRILPPVNEKLKNKLFTLSSEQLVKYLLKEAKDRSHWLNIFDRPKYLQKDITTYDFQSMLKNQRVEQNLISFLAGGFENPEAYSIPVLKEITRQAQVLSKSSFEDTVKRLKLQNLRNALVDSKAGTNNMKRLKRNYDNEKLKELESHLFKNSSKPVTTSKVETRSHSRLQASKQSCPGTSSNWSESDNNDQGNQRQPELRSTVCPCGSPHSRQLEKQQLQLFQDNKENIQGFYKLLAQYRNLLNDRDDEKYKLAD